MGMYYEEFEIGAVIQHAVRRTITETDNVLFCTMTMNPQPLHLDHEFASRTEFGKPLVNSIFTLGLVGGIIVAETTLGTTVANLGFKEVTFPSPVFAGDTIHVETRVLEKRESSSRPNAGIVTFEHRGINQRDEIVVKAIRIGMMLKLPETASVS
jgi:acyl dehydratase